MEVVVFVTKRETFWEAWVDGKFWVPAATVPGWGSKLMCARFN